MGDALGMRRVESVGNLDGEIQQRLSLKGFTFDAVLQRLALQQFHGNEGLPIVFVNFVNGANVGVIEGRGCLGFALETLERLMVLRQSLRQELQGDEAMQLGVFGLIDHTHPAAAQLLQNTVVRNRLAQHRWL
jgi:hypothetical protein